MNVFIRFAFYVFRKFNDGVPSRAETRWALKQYSPTRTIGLVMSNYAGGDDIDVIAGYLSVTRIRVRLLLIKGAAQARRRK